MLLKGKWGVGKTSAIRSLLDAKKGTVGALPIDTASYVSLAGINEIGDERTLFLLGLNEVPKWLEDLAGGASSLADAAAKGIGTAVTRALNSFVLVGMTSRMSGALVVIDEIERRGKDLDLKDVFGTVVRLVEDRGCKVVLILNEEGITEAEDKEILAWYREKIFDFEYEFRPTVKEATAAVAKSEEQKRLLRAVFEPLAIANLRIISQANRALVRFSEELSPVSSEGSRRICENVCKIAALRLTNKADIESSELEAAASFNFPWRQQDRKNSKR